MKRNRLFSLIIIIFFQYNLNFLSANENFIKGIKQIELSPQELSKLKITISENYVSYPDFYKPLNTDTIIFPSEVFMYNMQIDIRNKTNAHNPDTICPVPRFAVNKFENGSTAYFRNLKDYGIIMATSDGPIHGMPDTAFNYYAEANSLIGLHIKFDNPKAEIKHNDIYLWYEPTNEFIDRLPENYQKELHGEIDPASKKMEEGFTDNWRNKSEFISDCMVFPNPATAGYANIKFTLNESRTIDITLHDISGMQIKSVFSGQNFSAGEQIVKMELSNIPVGMYLISISSAQGESVVQRLIVTQ